MQFREITEGTTGAVRSAAIATRNRLQSLTSQLHERLGPWATVLGTVTANLLAHIKGLVLTLITLSKPLASRSAALTLTAGRAVHDAADDAVDAVIVHTKPLAARLAERLAPWTALLKDLVAVAVGAAASLLAVAVERSRPLTTWLRERLAPYAGPAKEALDVVTGTARRAAESAIDLARPLVTRLTDRFGVRMTVVGAATALFVGSTGSTAWAITAMDATGKSFPELAEDNTAATIAALSDDAALTAEGLTAAQAEALAEAEAEAKAAKKDKPVEPKAVGGLNEDQMDNAIAIIEAGEDVDLDRDAWAVALATAMQESKFKNYANEGIPESYDYEYQAVGSDHDSVGLFQQRPASGWGSVEELMDPKTSAKKFYNALKNVDGWEDMPVTVAAQTVQVSAFPDHYAQWEDLAWDIIESYEEANS